MASLTGNSISSSYTGLLKTNDNGVLSATEQVMTDGSGNASTISMGTASASFTGTLDLSGATVTGLPGGAPGLVLGTGSATQEGAPLSMASGSSVTTIAALARGGGDIAIGDNASTVTAGTTWPSSSIAIGHNATNTAEKSLSIGRNATVSGEKGVSIGYFTAAPRLTVRIGDGGSITNQESVIIGSNPSTGNGSKAVAIGWTVQQVGLNSQAIGTSARASGSWSFAGGYNTDATGEQSTAVGYGAQATSGQGTLAAGDRAAATGGRASALGARSIAALTDSVALGAAVTAVWASGTTVNQLAMANYASINYADDTAAAAGGVPLGGVYHNAGALRIRIA